MENKLCVLIDFENIAAGTEKEGLGRFDIKAVLRRLKDKGRILVSRSYGDWGRYAKFKQKLLEQS
ncbi:MAG: NYN domain-containing protein, partial [Myxococcota bacterium]|nr:NYN domain-containing protein [Myxococcota bacterium]